VLSGVLKNSASTIFFFPFDKVEAIIDAIPDVADQFGKVTKFRVLNQFEIDVCTYLSLKGKYFYLNNTNRSNLSFK
jgi:hypothetical protein